MRTIRASLMLSAGFQVSYELVPRAIGVLTFLTTCLTILFSMNEEYYSEPASVETQGKLLELKRILNRVSDISFSYTLMMKKYPLKDVSEQRARSLIEIYGKMVDEVFNIS